MYYVNIYKYIEIGICKYMYVHYLLHLGIYKYKYITIFIYPPAPRRGCHQAAERLLQPDSQAVTCLSLNINLSGNC